ncbi:MAG TPA: phospholipase D-like domain-containing protein [Pirellulales bacterium]|nr:phospholipase D-like domain-containing protein [Pirellulales bacterium]
MQKLITGRVWKEITARAKQTKRRSTVAVAYFSSAQLLPLNSGSTLVIDMSERAVRAGQTNPTAVVAMLRKGVNVHSVENLHAKVFVIGSRAIIGSANVSATSANYLIEAAIETNDRKTVKAYREWVNSLTGDRVTLRQAIRLQKLYVPPRGFNRRKKRNGKLTPQHSPLWTVVTRFGNWNEEEQEAEQIGTPKARKQLRSSRYYDVYNFSWLGSAFAKTAKRNDLVIEKVEQSARNIRIFPPRRIIHLQRYRNSNGFMCFLEMRKGLRSKSRKIVSERLGSGGRKFIQVKRSRLIRDTGLVHKLLQLWPDRK